MERINKAAKEMKQVDNDIISRMLGHSDTIHLFDDEICYEAGKEECWSSVSVNSSVVNMSEEKGTQTNKRFTSHGERYCNQQSRIHNVSPSLSSSRSCCNNEMCRGNCPRTILKHDPINISSSVNSISKQVFYRRLCLFSILVAFVIGVLLGVLIPFVYLTKDIMMQNSNSSRYQSLVVINKPVNYTSNSQLLQFNEKLQVNSTMEPQRVFSPIRNKIDYAKSKQEFPTIHDIKYKSKISIESSKNTPEIKLNIPKKFHSVSFVDDESILDDNMSDTKDEEMSATKETLLKYLDLETSNGTDKYFVDFGKKILESNLNENPLENANKKENDPILHKDIYWGSKIEKSLPNGFGQDSNNNWINYVKSSSAIKMESGCGRMQNRLVTFVDGTQACVRYRQNTDQIQGELFSFYLAQLLKLPNLAPSIVSIVNLTDPLWHNVASDIGSAQWNSNRPVVMTKYISNLESAHIPGVFKPSERHLNKYDVFNIVKKGTNKTEVDIDEKSNALYKKITEGLFSGKEIPREFSFNNIDENNQFLEKLENPVPETEDENPEYSKTNIGDALVDKFVELAQWSDLIVFDYLTANLDRIVNNLYNFQWNVNIMDAPAHNLARKVDSNLLMFLDNESGLLHGYRLLHKYEVYHSSLLDSLCIFRKTTADIIKNLHEEGNVGLLLNELFRNKNEANVLDILPPLPEKSIKILNERIARVAGRIKNCENQYGR